MVGTLCFAHPTIFTTKSPRLPILRSQLKFRKVESRRHGASDQCPVAVALGGLPGMRRHDRLRFFPGCEIGTELHAALPVRACCFLSESGFPALRLSDSSILLGPEASMDDPTAFGRYS